MTSDDKINILLVDDRPENLLALEAIIEREEYHLIKASSGEEALKFLLKYEFAAVLLDVQMPGMDGFRTAKIIKAREKTKNTPILFITANSLESEHIFTGYSIGAIDYILKPFDPIILKAKVEGFVQLYKMNQTLVQQAQNLTEKTKELENAYNKLSNITSELRVSEALANVINETSLDSMLIIDQEGKILKINPSVERMFQYDESSILGRNISILFKDPSSENFIQNVMASVNKLEHPHVFDSVNEVVVTRRDKTTFPAEIQIGKRVVQDRMIIACTIRDITKQKQYQEKVSHMAFHDGLTDLPNRRFLNHELTERIQSARKTNQPLSIMYIDMDRFKYINDSLGHFIGDKVLQDIAKRLTASAGDSGFVSRIGGDEFTILLPDTDREKALETAEMILENFKRPFYVDQYELFITTCIGISVFPYDGEDQLSLSKSADAALYRAKEQGKNQYKVYHSGMDIRSYRSFMLQNELRKAIEREEFTLVYQPRVDIESGDIPSAEALVRWEHPDWGTLLPAEFISLAEETGQIVAIGEWVLKTALKQSKIWQEKGLNPIQIAVNFSAQQFLQKDLIHTIETIIREEEVDPHLLEIEITESVLMGNEATVNKALNKLRKLGIVISMDDFGTGYSSLSYLRRFPIDTIKIDKSFIRDLSSGSKESSLLISTIISLAQSLDMSVIAEGVETDDQLNILRKHNCSIIQGYLFSPPIPASEFESFLIESQHKANSRKNDNITFLEAKKPDKNIEAVILPLSETPLEENKDIMDKALHYLKESCSLSTREMDVFELIVKGLNNKEISDSLFISEHTVKNHITRIFQKLTVNDRLQAMAKVYQTCMEHGKNPEKQHK